MYEYGEPQMKIKNSGMRAGWMCFYIHFVTEVACFFLLLRLHGPGLPRWTSVFMYDALAFVPQSMVGRVKDRNPGLRLDLIGLLCITAALFFFSFDPQYGRALGTALLCLGNCFTHISCADSTLRAGGDRIAPAAVFVGGGSFGVISGKLLDTAGCPYFVVMLIVLSAVPLCFLIPEEKTEESGEPKKCGRYADIAPNVTPWTVVIASVAVVAFRGFMGYGIPTSWNKTTFQTVMLYFAMGFGKSLGGFLMDRYGARTSSVISIAVSVPFLLFGADRMMLSLLGVMLFSMTMPITLGMIATVLPETPGLAFGLTTIGLFLGSCPLLFCKITDRKVQFATVLAASLVCLVIMLLITEKEMNEMKKEDAE